MRFSVRGSSKSDTPKQVTDKCVTIENTGGESSEHCNSSDPLVGRLETSTAMKLSFRLKNKISKERQNVKDDTEKALETEKASVRYTELYFYFDSKINFPFYIPVRKTLQMLRILWNSESCPKIVNPRI